MALAPTNPTPNSLRGSQLRNSGIADMPDMQLRLNQRSQDSQSV